MTVVVFHQNAGDYRPRGDDLVTYALADRKDVLPLGYPTEQLLTWMKNDVATKLAEARKQRKEELARRKR